MTRSWQALRPGDIVDIIAPGYRTSDVDLEGAVRFVRAWGLQPRVPRKIFGRDLLCANADEIRFTQLREALLSRDSRAVWCVRGGYGSIRLMPAFEKLRRPKGPAKLFLGISDITSVHVLLNQKWGWPTVHGPLLDRLGKKAALPRFERELKRFVFGEIDEISFTGLKPLNDLARQTRTVRGAVSGGNLITLQSSLATASAWKTDGRILFFEDIGERGYRVDRVLEQFTQAGLFRRARAVIFGQFTGGKEADGSTLVPAVLKRFAAGAGIPVLSGLESGHDVIQRPLPLETSARLELRGGRAALICASGGTGA